MTELVAEGSAGTHEHVWPVDGIDPGARAAGGAGPGRRRRWCRREAFAEWRGWKPAARSRVLDRLAELVRADREELARLCVSATTG